MDSKELYSIISLREALAGKSVSNIDALITRINKIKQEHIEAEEKAKASKEEKLTGIKEVQKLVKKYGLTKNDISGIEPVSENGLRDGPKRVMQARYRYVDVNGVEHTWSGQGKTPVLLRTVMERDGTTKKDYLISDNNQ